MELEVLPFRVQLASIQRSALPVISFYLLKEFLFPSTNNESFFSFTETEHEISVILDANSAQILASNASLSDGNITLCPQIWRCLQVNPGETGAGWL
jgi:hypothetical protein